MGLTPKEVEQRLTREMSLYRKDVETARGVWEARIEELVKVYWPLAMDGDYKAADLIVRMVNAADKVYGFSARDVVVNQQFIMPGQGTAMEQLSLAELRSLAKRPEPVEVEGRVIEG